MVSDDWKEVTIDDIKDPKKSAIAMGPFGSNIKTENFVPAGVPIIRGSNLDGFHLVEENYVFLTEEKADSLKSSNAFVDDIVFTHRGTLGQVGIIPKNSKYPRYIVSQSQMKLTCDKSKADPYFIFYFFKSPLGQSKLLANTSTTGVPAISRPLNSLKSIKISLPPLPEQKAIVRILSSLDDKIELNNRMNKTLEEMAQALFKSWFVDFDPVRAKAEGRQPEGMDEETAAMFPDSFEVVDGREIPVGWSIGTISNIAEVIDCLHSKKPERIKYGKPLLQLWNIRDDGLIDMTDLYHISEENYQTWISRIEASEGDCVITNVGRVGAVSQIPKDFKAALGRNMTAIRCKSDFNYPTFLIELLLSDFMRNEISTKTDDGTILSALNVRNIPKLRVILPPNSIVYKFEFLTRQIRKKMEMNLRESQKLAEIRDTLLPKLISGDSEISLISESGKVMEL